MLHKSKLTQVARFLFDEEEIIKMIVEILSISEKLESGKNVEELA